MLDLNDLTNTLAKIDVYEPGTELGYQAKRSGMIFAARRTADLMAGVAEGGAETVAETLGSTLGGTLEMVVGAEIARDVGAFAGAFGGKIIGLLGVGLAAGVSASFAQMDYLHQKSNIKNFYKAELGAKLHKDPKTVTVADMEKISNDIPILDEELKRARKQRNFSVPLAVVATLASFAAATIAVPAIVAALELPALVGLAGIMVKATVSLVTYFAVKTPLQMIGSKKLGLYEETANDRIFNLKCARKKGFSVTPEQVLGVFTKAHPELDAAITAAAGKPYDQLGPAQKHAVTGQLEERIPLQALADGINSGAMKTTELAFVVSGQSSGVRLRPVVTAAPVPEITTEITTEQTTFRDKFAQAKPVSYTERLDAAPEPTRQLT